MSLERAIRIFTEHGFSDPQWAVDTILKAESMDKLHQIMRDEQTCLSADQFISFRIESLYKGDPGFAQRTLEAAKARFRGDNIPDGIVDYYISHGGGVGTALCIPYLIESGKFGKVNINKLRPKLKEFYESADRYLLDALRSYVNQHQPATPKIV